MYPWAAAENIIKKIKSRPTYLLLSLSTGKFPIMPPHNCIDNSIDHSSIFLSIIFSPFSIILYGCLSIKSSFLLLYQDVHFFLLRFSPDVKLSIIYFLKHSNLKKLSIASFALNKKEYKGLKRDNYRFYVYFLFLKEQI